MEPYRTTLRIPGRIAEIIEQIINHRIDNGDGDSECINRSGVALEMMKIGAYVLKKRIENDGSLEKAYSKEFEILLNIMLSGEYFSRIAATGVSTNRDYVNPKSEHLLEIKEACKVRAKELLG